MVLNFEEGVARGKNLEVYYATGARVYGEGGAPGRLASIRPVAAP